MASAQRPEARISRPGAGPWGIGLVEDDEVVARTGDRRGHVHEARVEEGHPEVAGHLPPSHVQRTAVTVG